MERLHVKVVSNASLDERNSGKTLQLDEMKTAAWAFLYFFLKLYFKSNVGIPQPLACNLQTIAIDKYHNERRK
jgi:hypothetical protein